jgi:hypothetical protein
MKGFKGFDKDLKCRGKQYAIGQTFDEAEVSFCEKGMHFCEYPLDCFRYYSPAESRYAEIEAEAVSDKKSDDSKRAAGKITVKNELSLGDLVEAAVQYVFDGAAWLDANKVAGINGAASVTGYKGAASATGYHGAALVTGDRGAALATGNRGAAAATGDGGAALVTGGAGAASAAGNQGAASATGNRGAA